MSLVCLPLTPPSGNTNVLDDELLIIRMLVIIRIIKLKRMGWVGHVARMGEKRNVYRLFVGKPEGK
jgi:hypothetical protein